MPKEYKYPKEYYLFFVKFNEGEYYECHDLLEELWLADRDNKFLQGLLKLAVGIYHYEYGNVKGARAMFLSAMNYIEHYRPKHWGVDLEGIHHYLLELLNFLPEDDKIPFEEALSNPIPKKVLHIIEEE